MKKNYIYFVISIITVLMLSSNVYSAGTATSSTRTATSSAGTATGLTKTAAGSTRTAPASSATDTDKKQEHKLSPEELRQIEEKNKAIQQVSPLIIDRKYKEAIAILDTQIKKYPNEAQLYVLRAHVKELSNDYEGALKDKSELIRLRPDDNSFYIERGDLNLRNGKYEEAMKDFKAALSKSGDASFIYMKLAETSIKLNNCGEATKYLLKVKNYDENSEYLYYKGYCYLKLGNRNSAVENLTKASQLGNAEATRLLSTIKK